ncbi:MAG TPA: family 20 glycosylhydrolase [Rhodanobacter sp.]
MSTKIKRTIHLVFLPGLLLCASSTFARAVIAIIPKPQQMTVGEGHFVLDTRTGISAPGDRRGSEIANFLRNEVLRQNGITLRVGSSARTHRIVLQIDPSIAGGESYRLQVTQQDIRITASQDRGLFWGVQTLRQLLPMQRSAHVGIPVVDIRDRPAFGYRGTMLDVSRHFYPVAFVKKQLDLLSYYKINTFHWHLTDDQGWRIEIRKYPRLTEVGGWRTEDDGQRYGGFYTQAQVRDVVDYARRRNIMVIPEIEMPGHSMAALAAYPELSCTRQPLQVATTWGVHKDIYCVGDATTFTFLQNVLDEVIALFPAPYVHIGGDEVPKDRWKDCASCQQLMHAQNLKDEEGLQSYFIRRMQRYLAGKGKTLIGWDEILEGGVDSTAVVEVWRGDDEGRKAIANGNRIINAGPYYLDTPVPKLGAAAVYRLDPAAGFTAHREQVLGAEAPLWSERADPLNAENRLYPRLQAFAESLWTAGRRDDLDYANFQLRLQAQYPKLDALGIGYGAAETDVVDYAVSLNARRNGWQLTANRGFPDLRSRYTIDAGDPDDRSPGFLDNVGIRQPGVLKVAPFRHGQAYDHPRSFTLIAQLGLGKPIRLAQPPKPPYDGFADRVLLDGVLGGNDPKDGTWVGWEGSDMDATVDLGKPTAIHSIDVRFMQQSESWILLPRRVRFSISADGRQWTQLKTETIAVDPDDIRPSVRMVHFAGSKPASARYVRVEATSYGVLPVQHSGTGHQAWIFSDEILIR